ncbi:MAG TPA: hypothetical protein VGR46_00790 [Candidatus Limnocylindria bacterium]|nr:hypothetical protein [Candidatus Limnocylindria bacterium]
MAPQRVPISSMRHPFARNAGTLLIAALLAFPLALVTAQRAAGAAGALVADVVVNEAYPENIAPSVAFDGTYLYHVGYGNSKLHRINAPPAGSSGNATGQVDITITGAQSGIMTLAYDRGRDAFWAIGGDGLSMYLLRKSGAATLIFTIDPNNDRPGYQPVGDYPNEVKVAYDRADDTIWYSSDAGARIYHYHTYADAQGTAAIVDGTPYIDINVPPNDMSPQCPYSQSSGVAVGGAHLFVSIAGCKYIFEFTKTGGKVGAYPYTINGSSSSQDLECDNLSYGVSVFWLRDGYDSHIRAFEQPASSACLFGGGPGPDPTPTPPPTPTPTPPPTPTPTPNPPPSPPGLLPPLPPLPSPPSL